MFPRISIFSFILAIISLIDVSDAGPPGLEDCCDSPTPSPSPSPSPTPPPTRRRRLNQELLFPDGYVHSDIERRLKESTECLCNGKEVPCPEDCDACVTLNDAIESLSDSLSKDGDGFWSGPDGFWSGPEDAATENTSGDESPPEDSGTPEATGTQEAIDATDGEDASDDGSKVNWVDWIGTKDDANVSMSLPSLMLSMPMSMSPASSGYQGHNRVLAGKRGGGKKGGSSSSKSGKCKNLHPRPSRNRRSRRLKLKSKSLKGVANLLNPKNWKALMAKFYLKWADNSDDVDVKMAKAKTATELLGCPEGRERYSDVCDQIETAVDVLDEDANEMDSKVNRKDIPWTSPALDKAQLLSVDPGVWTIHDFIDKDQVDKLTNILMKYAETQNNVPCSLAKGDKRKCVYFGEADIKSDFDEEDRSFFMEFSAKYQSVWPQFNKFEKYGCYLAPEGRHRHYNYHWDGFDPWENSIMAATTVIWLSDGDVGGGKMLFPRASADGLTVTPRKGSATTWLTIQGDGSHNFNHVHGVQATTPESKGVLILALDFYISPVKLDTLTDDSTAPEL